MQPTTKIPTPPSTSNMDDFTQALEVEEVFEPLNFEKSESVVLKVTRSLDKQFREEEEEADKEDDVPLIRRNTSKGKRPLESPPPPAQPKRPKRATTTKKPELSSVAPSS